MYLKLWEIQMNSHRLLGKIQCWIVMQQLDNNKKYQKALWWCSLSDFLCCSIAREFCVDGGHTFTDQLDRVRRHCGMFKLCTSWTPGYPNIRRACHASFLFLQIQCILLDIGSNIATPRSSARESHMRMHFLVMCKAQKYGESSRDFGVICFCSVFLKRERDSPLSPLQIWRTGSTNLLRSSHHWPTSSFLWVVEWTQRPVLDWPCTPAGTVSPRFNSTFSPPWKKIFSWN